MKKRSGALKRRYGRAYTAKPLAFPDVKSFDGLFTGAREWSSKDLSARGKRASRGGREANTIGGYLTVSGRGSHESMFVTPSARLADWLSDNMLAIGDSINFEIVVRSDGALVIARYNKIIGSRWLAMIEPSTIPRFE